jgi:surface protein
MFNSAYSFNKDISNWSPIIGENFGGMFAFAYAFNQDISNWDVSSGSNFAAMFSNATQMINKYGNAVTVTLATAPPTLFNT